VIRADQLLVARGLASSRTLAQRLIEAGRVRADARPVRKASESLAEQARITLAPGDDDRFVSRGGLKLAGALAATRLDPRSMVCLDVGQSTGGFTDCLLQAGAARVVGLDVGHGQLHPSLWADPRVTAFEGLNARSIDRAALGDAMPAPGFDLIVADVSFISLTLVLPALGALATPTGRLLALVKPQFEVGREALDGRGIVRSADLYDGVREAVGACARGCGWAQPAWLDSPILGGDGNREFFIYALRALATGSAQAQRAAP